VGTRIDAHHARAERRTLSDINRLGQRAIDVSKCGMRGLTVFRARCNLAAPCSPSLPPRRALATRVSCAQGTRTGVHNDVLTAKQEPGARSSAVLGYSNVRRISSLSLYRDGMLYLNDIGSLGDA
jgi:hypothetical protein